MTSTPNVSIVVPIYNAEKYLENTIKNILCQEYQDFELLLIDDGSTDSSLRICYKYQQKDRRIRIFKQKNKGISSSRNRGIKEARGKWIAFGDHDDTMDDNLLLDNIILLEENSDADFIKFGRRKIFEKSGEIEETTFWASELVKIDNNNISDVYANLSGSYLLLYVWDCIFSLNFLRKNGICFDENIKAGEEDKNLMFECLESKPTFLVNPKCYYNHFYRGNNTTTNFSENRIAAVEISLQNEMKLMKKLGIYSKLSADTLVCDYVPAYAQELTKQNILSKKTYTSRFNQFVEKYKINKVSFKDVHGIKAFVLLTFIKIKCYKYIFRRYTSQ